MKPWQKYSLYGIGGLFGLWVLYRAFLRPREEVEVEGEGDIVPLLTPSAGTPLAGVSNFPSAPGSNQAFTAVDLINLERKYDVEDRDFAASQKAADQKRQDDIKAANKKIADDKAAAKKAADDAKAAASAAAAKTKQQDTIMGQVWKQVNDARIKAGKSLLVVCIRANGAIGIGDDQCKNAKRRYGA